MSRVLRSYLSGSVQGCASESSVYEQTLTANERFKLENEIEERFKPTRSQIPFKNYKKLNWKWVADENAQVLISRGRDVVMFHPVKSLGTSALRVDCPLKRNTYTYWQVTVAERVFGTSIMVGVGREDARKTSIGFLNLLGADSSSWGLSHKGFLWHGNEARPYCSCFEENKTVKIGCLFNGFNGELTYFVNDVYMGVAFRNISLQQDLYPMVSTTVARCCMRLDLSYQTFPSLQEMCRLRLEENKSVFKSIRVQYPYLPKFIEDYLLD
jgi:SPRY domain-containing SOCS box protein 3